LEQAIDLFTQALQQGLDWPAVHFNLAVLLQQLGRWEQAVPHFQRALKDPDYTAGAHFALGQGYQARGQISQALTHFLEALKLLELRAAGEEMHTQLIQYYDALLTQYAGDKPAEGALVLISSIVDFLSSPGWEQKVREARRLLDRFAGQGFVTSPAEALATPDAQSALEALAFSEEYMRRRWFASAAEECYRALGRVPGYLPLHIRLAEINALQGRTEDALQKYVAVAQTYRLRRQNAQAVQVYRLALGVAPLDTALRRQLIEELLALQQVDQALEEYFLLGDAYYHLAAIDECIATYQDALKLTARSANRTAWEARLLPKLADLYVQSVDWGKAREIYRRLSALPVPEDPETCLRRIDLAFKLEEIDAGLRELDGLLERLEREGAGEEAERILRSLVEAWPAIAPLQERTADWYLKQGRTEDAIRFLNTLGEMQLDAGLTEDAARTIRKLAALEPEKAGDYQRLLDYLLGSRTSQTKTDEPG
ncbi:MAG: tetratricopeptide repeat protein, partial [Anaerolineae bacterium]